MNKKWINLVFVLAVFVFLTVSMCRVLFFPVETNEYENRMAEQLVPLSANSYLDGSFQNGMETAMTDQVFLAQDLKKVYNTTLSAYMHKVVRTFAKYNNDDYIKIGGHYLYGQDHLMNIKHDFKRIQPEIDERIAQYNRLVKKYPEHEFYLYYIENDMDVRFDTDEHNTVFEYMQKKLNVPKENTAKFSIDSFEDFGRYFYKTDHHWNSDGSYRGYSELVRMLVSEEEPLLEPTQTLTISGAFSGSKAKDRETASFKEPFVAYRYPFIPMSTYGNDAPAPGYGNQELYLDGVCDLPLTYANYYGDDWGAVTLDTYQPEKETLLIIGDSYDNAVLRLLSKHFNRVISIDLRYFETYIGKPFSIDDCLAQYDIDKVLFMGYVDYFIEDDFSLEQ